MTVAQIYPQQATVVRSIMFVSRKNLLVFLLMAAIVLSACNGSNGDEAAVDASGQILTQAAEIASAGLTQTAEAAPPEPTEAPEEPTETPTMIQPTEEPTTEAVPTNALAGTLTAAPEEDDSGAATIITPGPTLDPNAPPTAIPSPTSQGSTSDNCYKARFEGVETIPDGTRMPLEKRFTKTWRVKNIGTCTWTIDMEVFWVQGDLIGADSVNRLTEVEVPPNGYAEVAIEMKTPNESGTYKGYWKLRHPTRIFGVGPLGNEPLWVEISAYDPDVEAP